MQLKARFSTKKATADPVSKWNHKYLGNTNTLQQLKENFVKLDFSVYRPYLSHGNLLSSAKLAASYAWHRLLNWCSTDIALKIYLWLVIQLVSLVNSQLIITANNLMHMRIFCLVLGTYRLEIIDTYIQSLLDR